VTLTGLDNGALHKDYRSVAQVAEMTRNRGLAISSSWVWRRVQTNGAEPDKRSRPHLKPTNRSRGWMRHRLIKGQGQERLLYRAVDSSGQTIYFQCNSIRTSRFRQFRGGRPKTPQKS